MIATVDDGRRWVLRIPAPSRGKREGRTRGAGAGNAQESPAVRGAGTGAWPTPSSLPIPCSKTRLRWSSSLVRPRPTGSCRRTRRSSRRASRPALAALHAVPISAAVDAGMLIRTPTQARQKVADDVDRVRREFVVNDKRLHRWQRWLDDDSSWPDFSVVVHGDLYVAMCSSTTRSASAG
ncbi:phosphotransferase [Escherichia coli]|uniref:phosphotransferase n=1 Tax=Escherichia coli TaxID=562 RepID=UPI0032E5307C